jgi:hypothetical protein
MRSRLALPQSPPPRLPTSTDLGLELDNMARFLSLAVQHKQKIGFKGTLLLEPKPQEPTKHQVGAAAGAGQGRAAGAGVHGALPASGMVV